MADELNEAALIDAATAVGRELAHELSRGPLVRQFDAMAISRAAVTAYLAATTPTTGIEGVTNQEVDEFLKENRGATTPEAEYRHCGLPHGHVFNDYKELGDMCQCGAIFISNVEPAATTPEEP